MVDAAGYLRRYQAGEHEAVWADMTALGAEVRKPPHFDHGWAVARETMRRARHNLELIVRRLDALGYQFWDGKQGKRGSPPRKLNFGGTSIEVLPSEPRPLEALLTAMFAEAKRRPPGEITPVMIEQLYNIYRSAAFPYQDHDHIARTGQLPPLHAAASTLFTEAKKLPAGQITSDMLARLHAAHRAGLDEVIGAWRQRRVRLPTEAAKPPQAKPGDHLRDKRVLSPPTKKQRTLITKLEKNGMALPLSLRAWFEEVGEVNLTGAHPALCFWQDQNFPGVYADPLVVFMAPVLLEGEAWLEERVAGDHPAELEALIGWNAEAKARLTVANEELDYGYTMILPDAAADARLSGAPDHATFVHYLRTSFPWGGFPGWKGQKNPPEKELKLLTEGLLEI